MGFKAKFEIYPFNTKLPLIWKECHLTTGKIESSFLMPDQKDAKPGDLIHENSYLSIVIDDRKNEELLSKELDNEIFQVVNNDKPFLLENFPDTQYLSFQLGSSWNYILLHPTMLESCCLATAIPNKDGSPSPIVERKWEWNEGYYEQKYFILF